MASEGKDDFLRAAQAEDPDAWTRRIGDPTALRAVLDTLPLEVYVAELDHNGDLRTVYVNAVAAAARGVAPDELYGWTINSLCRDGVHRYVDTAFEDAIAQRTAVRSLAVVHDDEGHTRMHHVSIVPVFGKRDYFVGIADPPFATVWAPGLARADLVTALDATADMVARFDPRLRHVYVNRAVERVFGIRREHIVGRTSRELGISEPVAALWDEGARSVFETGEPTELEYAFETADGHRTFQARLAPERGTSGEITSVITTTRDITEQRSAADALAHLATHDAVTQLPNRRLLFDRLRPALARAERSGREVALLFCDLDGFKRVNDTLGHSAGDEVLREIGRRIAHASRAADTVASFGGDEFVVLCEDLDDRDVADSIAQRIAEAVNQPIDLFGTRVHVSVSVGVAYGDRNRTGDELIAEADRRMYAEKVRRKRS